MPVRSSAFRRKFVCDATNFRLKAGLRTRREYEPRAEGLK